MFPVALVFAGFQYTPKTKTRIIFLLTCMYGSLGVLSAFHPSFISPNRDRHSQNTEVCSIDSLEGKPMILMSMSSLMEVGCIQVLSLSLDPCWLLELFLSFFCCTEVFFFVLQFFFFFGWMFLVVWCLVVWLFGCLVVWFGFLVGYLNYFFLFFFCCT